MPSLLAQALWPFPAPHLGLAEGHWHSPGSKILGLAQGGLSCSFKLWGSVHRPPIVLGSSFVMSLPSAVEGHHAIQADPVRLGCNPPQIYGVSFLEGFDIVELPDTLDADLALSPHLVLVILEVEVRSPPLHCTCLRCQEHHLAFPSAGPSSPLGIHVLFTSLGRRSEFWEWVQLELRGHSQRVVLCNHSQAHRLWAAHRLQQHPWKREAEVPTLHLW